MFLKRTKSIWKILMKEFIFLERYRLKKSKLSQVFSKDFVEVVCSLPLYFEKLLKLFSVTPLSYLILLLYYCFMVVSLTIACKFAWKRTQWNTHLQELVDLGLKKQFSCVFFWNFVAANVIKASVCVSAWFCTSCIKTMVNTV